MIGIDFIGPISPKGSDGDNFILTITDYFTKLAEAVTTPDNSAPSVANVLFKVVHNVAQCTFTGSFILVVYATGVTACHTI